MSYSSAGIEGPYRLLLAMRWLQWETNCFGILHVQRLVSLGLQRCAVLRGERAVRARLPSVPFHRSVYLSLTSIRFKEVGLVSLQGDWNGFW
jgi:hypothetical protein